MQNEIVISKGNSKIGKIPNISLPPGVPCGPGAKCYSEGCYAKNSYRMYPNVRKAWDGNWGSYKFNPWNYFVKISNWIAKYQPHLFRWHVGGDIPSQTYLDYMVMVAQCWPDTQFLAFTKRYEFDYSDLPENLNIILSVWPSMPKPKNLYSLGMAFLEEDPRWDRNGYYLRCPGNCGNCGNLCWSTVCSQVPVVLQKH